MRVNIYETMLNADMNTILIKEKSMNYQTNEFFNTPANVVNIMNDIFDLNKKAEEHVYMIALNVKFKPLGFFLISKGNVNTSILGAREILIRALLIGASEFMLFHNHPSTCTEPSIQDKMVTSKIKDAADIVGIRLTDHIIVGGANYFSFKENCLI